MESDMNTIEHCGTHLFICPLCRQHFSRVGNVFTCASGHSFDIAKEGYVNLVARKLASSVGDSKVMLQARRNFLERGHYQPLSALLSDLVATYVRARLALPCTVVLDIGCGEGYYLGQVQQRLTRALPLASFCLLGVDVAKDAIRMAARRYKTANFVVADLKAGLVFTDDCVHVLLNIFAPRNVSEFMRVLTPGGIAIIAIPQPIHLQQLRSLFHLLSIEEQKEQLVITQFLTVPHCHLVTTCRLTYQLDLTREEIALLVTMMPAFRHLSSEARSLLESTTSLQTDVSFTVLVFEKRQGEQYS
jgi:23S rRNA (guanine745-N1)-methyltransferase